MKCKNNCVPSIVRNGFNTDLYTLACCLVLPRAHERATKVTNSKDVFRCSAYIFLGVKNVPVDVSAHARYM